MAPGDANLTWSVAPSHGSRGCKPDVVCCTESWLHGVQPGKSPTVEATCDAEMFPPNYKAYRNDRGTLGGGVFVLVHESLVSSEQPAVVDECKIVWVKISITGNRDLYVAACYMPHRNHKDLETNSTSLSRNSATKDATPSSVGTSIALMWTGQPVLCPWALTTDLSKRS